MSRREIIKATIEAVATHLELVATEVDDEHDVAMRIAAGTVRINARRIRDTEDLITRMVEQKLGPVLAYDLEAEGNR